MPAGVFRHAHRSPSVMPTGPPFLSFPQVVSGNPRSFLLPRRQTCGVPPPQHGRPLAPGPYLWIPAFAGMTVMCDAGITPRPTQPPPSFPPVPFRPSRRSPPSFPPVPSVLPVGPLRPSRRSPPSFPPVPSVLPTGPPSVIPAGCKRESMVFSPPPKADMRRPTTPTRPAPGSRPVPLDSRLRGNDSRVRRGERPTTTPAPSVPPTGPLRHARPSPSVTPTRPLRHPRRAPLSVIPAGCKRESRVFSPHTKADMRRTSTPNTASPWLPTRASGFPLSRE